MKNKFWAAINILERKLMDVGSKDFSGWMKTAKKLRELDDMEFKKEVMEAIECLKKEGELYD